MMTRKHFEIAYDAQIRGVSRAQGVDMGVAYLMVLENARLLKSGNAFGSEWKSGMGLVDVDALIRDADELEASKRK